MADFKSKNNIKPSTDHLDEPNNFISSLRQNPQTLLLLGLFLAGLFLLALGAGLFLFRGSTPSDDIKIISTESETEGEIVVHIDGAIEKAGVYKLPKDVRVSDAVSAAGGLTADADQSRINLAAKLADGQKIYIAKVGENIQGQSLTGSAATGLINMNTATEAQLDTLPGVGPVTAQKIIASRPYSSLEELLSKKAVGRSTFEKIKDLVTVY